MWVYDAGHARCQQGKQTADVRCPLTEAKQVGSVPPTLLMKRRRAIDSRFFAGSARSTNAPFDGAGLAGLGARRSADSDGTQIRTHRTLRKPGTGPGTDSIGFRFHDVQLDSASATGAAAKRREWNAALRSIQMPGNSTAPDILLIHEILRNRFIVFKTLDMAHVFFPTLFTIHTIPGYLC